MMLMEIGNLHDGGMRTANSSNKSSDVLSTQNQQKAAKSRRDKNVSKKNT